VSGSAWNHCPDVRGMGVRVSVESATPEAAARIQRAEAIKNGGKTEAEAFPARAQRAAAKQRPQNPN